jgi:uncharacterized membrane protein
MNIELLKLATSLPIELFNLAKSLPIELFKLASSLPVSLQVSNISADRTLQVSNIFADRTLQVSNISAENSVAGIVARNFAAPHDVSTTLHSLNMTILMFSRSAVHRGMITAFCYVTAGAVCEVLISEC